MGGRLTLVTLLLFDYAVYKYHQLMSRLKSLESEGEVLLEMAPFNECLSCEEGKGSLSQDTQTALLYFKLKDISMQPNQQEAELLMEASQRSRINSHLAPWDPSRRKRMLDDCFVISGVVLRRDNSPVPNRSRSYSIVKTSLQRKPTITEEEFRERMKTGEQPEEIVYGYNIAQHLGQFSMELAHQSPSSQARSSPIKYKIAHQSVSPATPLHKAHSQLSTQFRDLSSFQPTNNKQYKFPRFHPSQSGRKSKKEGRVNLFNFADQSLNRVGTSEQVESNGCFCSDFRVVEAKKGKSGKEWT